jgi:FkbM family methyltransferase
MSPYTDPKFLKVLEELGIGLGAPNVIYELGARDALDSIALAECFRNSRVHAFECLPSSLMVCRKNLSECPPEVSSRITLNGFGVGDANGARMFYEYDGNIGASSFLFHVDTHRVKAGIAVQVRRLDEYIGRGSAPPDLVCADIQGFELPALRGLGPHLAGVRALILETPKREELAGNYRQAPGKTEVLSFLGAQGFRERERTYENDNEDNVLFARA